MLTTLATLKARLSILDTDTQYDALLTNTLKAISLRFDHETNRTLARTENLLQEFDADTTEICLVCYPLESLAKFELKANETDGWLEQFGVQYLLRHRCIVSLSAPLGGPRELARVTYNGGYVLPGATLSAGQTGLPDDLEQAAVEQAVFWFQNRDKVGLIREWPKGGTYQEFADLDLLPNVRAVLADYARWQW
jgi:hypothetical protein